MTEHRTIRVLAFQDEGAWVAQCLEHDVCVQADDLEGAQIRMEIAVQREEDFWNLPAAPRKFFDMWDRRSGFAKDGKTGGVEYEMALCA